MHSSLAWEWRVVRRPAAVLGTQSLQSVKHFSLLTDTQACKLTLASLGELNNVPLGEDD